MVLEARTTAGHAVAMKVELHPTPEDLRRLAALCALPGMADATWTAKPGDDVR